MRFTACSIFALACSLAIVACAVGSNTETSEDGTLPDAATKTASTSSTSSSGTLPSSDTTDPDASEGEDAAKSADAAPPEVDASMPDSATSTSCAGYAAPSESAACTCAKGETCDANNCYGGYYCSLTVSPNKCVPKPSSCP